ncbi:hypothetical protein AB6A40_007093 [Gnathostoma spinigerum]|uniref:Uncharacterized protein n=1 Tax=Gnathostoma spinigerum TaxID=75299 RepID=A0ABD6EK83_9BILA
MLVASAIALFVAQFANSHDSSMSGSGMLRMVGDDLFDDLSSEPRLWKRETPSKRPSIMPPDLHPREMKDIKMFRDRISFIIHDKTMTKRQIHSKLSELAGEMGSKGTELYEKARKIVHDDWMNTLIRAQSSRISNAAKETIDQLIGYRFDEDITLDEEAIKRHTLLDAVDPKLRREVVEFMEKNPVSFRA